MIDRNIDLISFRDRIREKCGNDFATVPQISKDASIGINTCYALLRNLTRLGKKVYVDDAAEILYNQVRPRAKRCG